MEKMKKNKNKKYVFIAIIFLLIVYILFFDSASFYKKHEFKKQLQAVKADIEALEGENQRLREENEKLAKDMKTWEKKARELGMQKENEEIFLFKEDDE